MSTVAQSIRCVAPVETLLGEGPLWDPRIGKLLFLDIKGRKIIAFDPQTERTEIRAAPGTVSALGLRASGGYVCAHKDGFAFLELTEDGVRLTPAAAAEGDKPENRFNDGKVDPFGGFWAGTMDERETNANAGSWWRLGRDGRATKIDEGFHVTNGPAFDPLRERVYFTDSARQTVFVARPTEKGFESKKTFLQFVVGDGYPDGMDVDTEGHIWIAFWDGSVVRRFSPAGVLAEEVMVPAPRPTSIALVGDRAYVTSARIGLSEEARQLSPAAGGLFEITLARSLGTAESYYAG